MRIKFLAMRLVALLLLLAPLGPLFPQQDCGELVVARIRLDPGHPWRPPFGLERVGKPITAWAEAEAAARPEKLIHPLDLGTIFVPHDWLILV